jgi:transcriptional regulator with XRE-family HTH domain
MKTGPIVPVNWGFWAGRFARMLRRDLSRAFGVVLRKYRKAASMSQEKLSEKADIDVKMIGRIENFIRNPSLNLADSLAHALGVPLWQMIREAEALRQQAAVAKKR